MSHENAPNLDAKSAENAPDFLQPGAALSVLWFSDDLSNRATEETDRPVDASRVSRHGED